MKHNPPRLIILLLMLFLQTAIPWKTNYAVQAYPYPVEFRQPNGNILNLRMKGDECVKWAETMDGYSLLRNAKGAWEYATLDANGDMVTSGFLAKNPLERKSEDILFLNNVPHGLRYSVSQIQWLKSIQSSKSANGSKAFTPTGTKNLLMILVDFPDQIFTKTQTNFNNLMNQVGYNTSPAIGSVKDFYLENSYGQFTINTTVVGPYRAANNMAYYGGNDGSGNDLRPDVLASEAVTMANPAVNYADFDNDNDGEVDGVYIIYAGYGEEAGASANAIWAHAWAFSPLTLDGKTVRRYSCSAELRGNTGTTITAIGVICHEFGHVCGAPDYYDTNYGTNGQYDGTGNWDMMASGSWNNNGDAPAHHNMYTKSAIYGWVNPITLSTAQTVTMTNAEQNAVSYLYTTTTANEYFLLENRQQVGFDVGLPGHGMIIYHVDGSYITAHSSSNDINAGSHQGMYPVCANAAGNPTAVYGTINGGGCPFPGTGARTQFTDATTPNARSWAGSNTNKSVLNITESSSTITFCFISCSAATISTGTINPTTYCAGASVSVPYTITGTFNAGNVFTAQLSDAAGSFASPVSIGTRTATNAGTITATIPLATPAGTGYRIRVIASNPSVTGTANTSNITINTVPAQPSAMSGQASPCQGANETYSVTNVAGTTYTWTFPAGWIVPAGTSNSKTVTVGANSGNITVTPSNSCGNGTARTLAVTIATTPGITTHPIGTTRCEGTALTLNVVGSGSGLNYQWRKNGVDIVGATTASLSFASLLTTDAASYTCRIYNGCGSVTSNAAVIVINPLPAQPSTISGPANPAAGSSQSYSVTNTAGVTYNWNFPSGWTQTAGGTTNSVSVNVGTTVGNITVTPVNACGSGTPRILAAAPTSGNDDCSGAILVSCGNNYTGNTSTSTSTNDPTGTCGTAVGTPGVWYRFTGTGDIITASLCASSFDTKINIYSGSCSSYTCVGGNDDDASCASGQSSYTFATTAGQNYFIFIGGYNGANGDYSLSISCCTPSVPNIATNPSISNGAVAVSTCAPTLSWTAPANSGCNGASSYDIYFGTSATPSFYTNTTANSYSFVSNLNPSTTYYWKIVSKNAIGDAVGSATWSFTTSASACSNNDFCSGATTVVCGNSYTGTTTTATSTNDPTGNCGTDVEAPGRWYKYIGNGSVVTASLCTGTNYDSKINIYSGNCTSLTCIGGNDDACSSQSSYTFPANTGTDYYIFINGYGGATGDYTLSLSCCSPSAPTCATLNTPANGATGVNPCNTQLDWNSVAGSCGADPSYDVYFGTNSNPPFILNTTADNISIPYGLNDNTTYYWKIVPRTGNALASGCSIRSFTTGTKANPYYCMVDDAINYPTGGSNCAQMTPNSTSQRGCIWNTGSISFLYSFDYTLNMYFGNDDAGADGCTFVFQNSPLGVTACGNDGVQIGAGGIENALVVEFDTYDNGSEDPDEDHTAIYINGDLSSSPLAGPIQADPNDVNIEDGEIHALRVTWDAATQTLCVYVDGNQRICTTNDFVNSVFAGNPDVTWGFTASTGAFTNQQYFCPVNIPLPVILQRYDIACSEDSTILQWQTLSEENNAYFVIERSLNDQAFEAIGIVSGAGNSNTVKNYQFSTANTATDNQYFRLLQVDYDGKASNLGVRQISCPTSNNELSILSMYQKEDKSLLIELSSDFLGDHYIQIVDANSRILMEKTYVTDNRNSTILINLPENISEAIYYLRIFNQHKSITSKQYIY